MNNEEIGKSLARIEQKLDELFRTNAVFFEKHDTHDKRLNKLEGWRNFCIGAWAATNALFIAGLAWFKK